MYTSGNLLSFIDTPPIVGQHFFKYIITIVNDKYYHIIERFEHNFKI